MRLPRAPVLTQQYQFQKVVEGADLRSAGIYPGALLFPATHQTALMNVVCASSLWFYRSHLEYFRAQKIFTTYLLLTNHSECKCVSDLLRKNKPEGPRMLRDTGRTPKVLPSLPPKPSQPWTGETWSRAVAPGAEFRYLEPRGRCLRDSQERGQGRL